MPNPEQYPEMTAWVLYPAFQFSMLSKIIMM